MQIPLFSGIFFDRKRSAVKQIFLKVKTAGALRPVSFELHNPFCYPLNIDFGSFVEGITMKKLFLLLFSLFWSFSASSVPFSFDIHTPNEPKSMQVAKVYFLPDWRDKGMFWDGADEKPCSEVCPQKTDYDCKYGTENYVNGCGLTCSRCVECSGCEEQGYTLSECPVNGICLNDCCNKLYKITDCNSGYVFENNGCRAESCSENASLCDSATEKCVNGQCVEKDCTEYPGKCGSNQTCVDGECIAKDCNNTPSLCTATEKCLLQDGVYKCGCSPTCGDETNCPNGTETIANGCGGICTVCAACKPTCRDVSERDCLFRDRYDKIDDGCYSSCNICGKNNDGYDGTAIIFTFSPDADNVELTLPTYSLSWESPSYTVDWGDGTIDRDITADKPKHTYATAGNYDVKITGRVISLVSFPKTFVRYDYNLQQVNLVTFITEIKRLDLSTVRALSQTFDGGKNIRGSIPPLPADLREGYRAFWECSQLSGNLPKLPEGFQNAMQMFAGCSGLTGTIPEMPESLADGSGMFRGCSGLTGNIPRLPNRLIDVSYMFEDCSGLSGVTPVNGQYPYQYLQNFEDYRGYINAVTGCSDTVLSKFPESWGGSCRNCL